MEFRGNDHFATILAFSLLGNNTGNNEQFLFLCKNDSGDEEIWYITPLSIIKLGETTLDKPGFVMGDELVNQKLLHLCRLKETRVTRLEPLKF